MRIWVRCIALLFFVGVRAAYAISTPAEIDRLRMHADAGRDAHALASLLAAARTGNVDAQRAVGDVLLRRPDVQSAHDGMAWLERAAQQGDARAMLALGRAWLLGTPIIKADAEKAREWFARANPEINPHAAYYLGLIEKLSHGKPADYIAAVKYFQFAASQGIADAMYLLGNAYSLGEGVDAEPREAMRWYLRAAALDHPLAIQEIAHAYSRGDTLLPQSDFQASMMLRAVEHALRHPKSAP
jgi:uncharacterized protein